MSEIDTGKLIGDIIAANAEKLFESSKSFLSDKSNQIRARLTSTFSVYLANIERKYSSTKTIIYRDTPQSIKKFYEPIDLYNNENDLTNPSINDLISFKLPIIITGTGGSGKSTFLKYLLLNTLEITKAIPLFVELRLVEQEQKQLLNYLSDTLQLSKVNLGPEYLQHAFENGNFIFLLDGLDELSQNFYHKISNQIDNFTQQFPKCTFIVTSRPGQDFISWSNFIELKTKPLTINKATSLINRLNFDKEIKANFIKQLKNGLYESHTSFFENPLLLSIMLITFRDSASIPTELHNFYSLAFEALYYRHDASKSFKRPTLTNLPVNKGKDIMAAFSLITYINNQTIFSSHELSELLLKSMKLSEITCNVDELISDLLRAYCMLLQDGTKYQYTHRSFQEYFAACYLISANDNNQIKLIKQFCNKADTDITLQLAYGMNPKMIEEKLIIPFLNELKINIEYESILTVNSFTKFAITYFDKVSFFPGDYPTLSVSTHEKSSYEKFINLKITKFIMNIFNISNEIEEKTNPFIIKENEIVENSDKHQEIEVEKAFNISGILDWFVTYSLESKVIEQLMSIEKTLIEKNKSNDDLFNSLLKDKNQDNLEDF